MTRRNTNKSIIRLLMVAAGTLIALFAWNRIAPGQPNDLAWQGAILGTIIIGIGAMTKGRTITALNPIAGTPAYIIGLSIFLGALFVQIESSLPFSIYTFSIDQSLESAPTIALIIFGLIYPTIEEPLLFGGWMPTTFSKFFGGLRQNSFLVALIATAIISVLFHVGLGEAITASFLISHFVFRNVVSMLNLALGSWGPGWLIHTFRNSFVIGALFSLPITTWILPVIFVAGVLFFLSNSQRR